MRRSLLLTFVVSLLIVCALPSAALARYGDLDASFGNNGKVRLPKSLSANPRVIRIQPDGKILVATTAGLFRLTRAGRVDKTFKAGGRYGSPHDMELLDGGRIAVIDDGRTLTVLKQNGERDRGFAGTGTLTLGTGTTGMWGRSIAVQDGTKILVSGSIDGSTTTTSMIRVDSKGVVDPTFGNGGRVTVDGGAAHGDGYHRTYGSAIAVNRAGEILLGIDELPGVTPPNPPAGVVKFSRDGARITDFGIGGIAPVQISSSIRFGLVSIVVASSGNFVAIGADGFWGRGVEPGYNVNLIDANGIPVNDNAPVGDGATTTNDSGFVFVGFKALRSDFSPDARLDTNGVASVTSEGGCDGWGPVAAYPNGALVSMSAHGDCDDDSWSTHLVVVRLLGPSGGVAAPRVSITSYVNSEYQHGGIAATWLRSVSGVAGPAGSVRGVGVAIQRVDSKLLAAGRCRWLTHHGTKSVTTRATRGACRAPRFMRATGGAEWKFTLQRPLPLGKYRLYARATLNGGAHTAFTSDPDNFRSFTVTPVE